jgi:indolepyruvate ferredoxin oxidoreductase
VDFLTAYQNAAYAQSYQIFVDKVRAVEAPLGKTALTEAVARYLFKLMAYKDEYEVARLHTDAGFLNKVNAMFEGDFKLNYHLAPPLIASKNEQGELQKQQFGPWMLAGFKVLVRLKGLRGTPLDIFGRTEERKMERALIDDYKASIEEVLSSLTTENHATALEIARIPELIKGYGHVKARHLATVRPKWAALMRLFRQSARAPQNPAA